MTSPISDRLPAEPMLRAVVTRLDNELEHPVYSFVPAKERFPYIKVGSMRGSGTDNKTAKMQAVGFVVDVYTAEKGWSEATEIGREVVAAITQTPMNLDDGWEIVQRAPRFTSWDLVEGEEVKGGEIVRQAVLRFDCEVLDVA